MAASTTSPENSQIVERHLPSIPEFYDGKTLFITGFTGFVGKVLVEKLLRSCPGIKTIYVLLRPKKGIAPSARLDTIFSCQLFDNLKKSRPSSIGKVVPIIGDIAHPDLGLSPSQRELLANHVQVVFHCAATVKFNEPLKAAVEVNVLGTKRLLQLCKEMKKLMSVVHISTAYANCTRHESLVEEVIYPPPAPVKKFIDTVEWMDDDILETITPHILRDWPNTYTFTKALAECLTAEESNDIPFAIVRPSIVTSAWKEPIPGWVDNANGITGTMIGVGKGVVRSIYGHNVIADLIPVDTVANLTIAVGWYTATGAGENAMKVYHCTSSSSNPITWPQIGEQCVAATRRYPSMNCYRYPEFCFKSSKPRQTLSAVFNHWIPALFTDGARLLLGKKPKMHVVYDKLHRSMDLIEYFTTHEWIFNNKNTALLTQTMVEDDRKNFGFDVSSLCWSTYWEDYILGLRKYILKEENSTLLQARLQNTRQLKLQKMARFTATLIGVAMLLRKFRFLRKLSTYVAFAFLRLLLKLILTVAA